MSKWYQIKAMANGKSKINIHDEIGTFGVSAKDFINDVNALDADEVVVSIHSPGGSLFDGLAMYNALKASGKTIETRVEGIAASAASIVFLAGSSRVMPKDTFLMIHNPWSGAMGDAEEMRSVADSLEQFQQAIINIYARETNLPEDEVRTMMAAETWLDSKDAVDMGFATSVEDAVKVAALSKDFAKHFEVVPKALAHDSENHSLPEINTLREFENVLRDAGGFSRLDAKDLVSSFKRIIARDAVDDESTTEAINMLSTFKIGE